MKIALAPLAFAPLLVATVAHAQTPPPKDPFLAVEIRFGPYRPSVDDAFSGASEKPYDKVFGDATRFMIGAEVDWQLVHIPHFGSLGIGGLVGYTKATAKANFTDGSGVSGEDTAFSLWMLGALAVLRVDVLARETWIPLVPYVKAGPALGLWSSTNGLGASRVGGRLGEGRTGGMFYAVGGMFLLDILDRQAAKTFSAEQGVHHTYLFGELTMAEIRGLGQTGAMQVGDRTWTLGIAVEM
ncbi:MAG: hypothetical protein HYV09_26115 [Deltaproteobacteria bacterium]|nr:hypothetical protein [Deltaproteobacteria bacterium]